MFIFIRLFEKDGEEFPEYSFAAPNTYDAAAVEASFIFIPLHGEGPVGLGDTMAANWIVGLADMVATI